MRQLGFSVFSLAGSELWRYSSFTDAWVNLGTPAATATITEVCAVDTYNVFVLGTLGGTPTVWEWYEGRWYDTDTLPTVSGLGETFALSRTAAWVGDQNGRIHFWNGAAWAQQYNDGVSSWWGLWGRSLTDVWAVGYNAVTGGSIAHFDGQTWTDHVHGLGGGTTILTSVWAAAANDVYAAGYTGAALTVFHFDGATWTDITSAVGGDAVSSVVHVTGSSADDVVISTYNWSDGPRRWNGASWIDMWPAALPGSGTRYCRRSLVLTPGDIVSWGTYFVPNPDTRQIARGGPDGWEILATPPVSISGGNGAILWAADLQRPDGSYHLIGDDKDYEIDEGGRLKRDKTIVSRCRARVLVHRGKWALDPDFGSRLWTIKTLKGAGALAMIYIEEALADLIAAGEVVSIRPLEFVEDYRTGALGVRVEVALPRDQVVPLGIIPLGE
jgi:phage gp46-like protein